MYKYNPADFPYPINGSIEKVYKLHTEKNALLLSFAIDDLYYDLKNLQTYKLMDAAKVHELQNYFRSLLVELLD